MAVEVVATLVLTGVLGFLGWLIKNRFDVLDELSIKVNSLEVRMDILGDINKNLADLKTDVEIIKSRMEG